MTMLISTINLYLYDKFFISFTHIIIYITSLLFYNNFSYHIFLYYFISKLKNDYTKFKVVKI